MASWKRPPHNAPRNLPVCKFKQPTPENMYWSKPRWQKPIKTEVENAPVVFSMLTLFLIIVLTCISLFFLVWWVEILAIILYDFRSFVFGNPYFQNCPFLLIFHSSSLPSSCLFPPTDLFFLIPRKSFHSLSKCVLPWAFQENTSSKWYNGC